MKKRTQKKKKKGLSFLKKEAFSTKKKKRGPDFGLKKTRFPARDPKKSPAH